MRIMLLLILFVFSVNAHTTEHEKPEGGFGGGPTKLQESPIDSDAVIAFSQILDIELDDGTVLPTDLFIQEFKRSKHIKVRNGKAQALQLSSAHPFVSVQLQTGEIVNFN